ncbi:MAG: FAD:protein FMN transferase [Telluria sp.]
MGGVAEIQIDGVDLGQARSLAQAAIHEVERIERKFSRYLPGSVVGRINGSGGGQWVECDAETLSLLGFADALFNSSGGLFDITSGVLRRAWNFKAARRPEVAELAQLCQLVGWQRVERNACAVRLPAGMEIDFGGFGKEYAADRAAALLAGRGAGHALVNLAGDVSATGPKADGQPWLIGIAHPRRTGGLIATVPLSYGGLATSGDYERFFEQDGKRYCHVLDPRNGEPVTYWQSVSVMAPRAIAAGACATVAMLKQSEGLDFLRQAGLGFLAIDQHGHLHQHQR